MAETSSAASLARLLLADLCDTVCTALDRLPGSRFIPGSCAFQQWAPTRIRSLGYLAFVLDGTAANAHAKASGDAHA